MSVHQLPGNRLLRVLGIGGLFLFVVFLALVLGLASAILPWWFLLAMFLSPMVAVLVWTWPTVGLFIALCFVFGLVPSFLGPNLNVGAGSLKAGDIILIVTFLAAWAKALIAGQPWFYRLHPYLVPLGLLSLSFVVSMIYGKLYLHNEAALTEGRSFIAWLVLPSVLALVRNDDDRRRLLWALLAIAMIAAGGVIAQALTGIRLMELGRVENLDLSHVDVTRVTAGGVTYLMAFFLYRAMARQLMGIGNLLETTVVSGIIVLALVLTFGRGVWVTTITGAILVMFVSGGIRTAVKGIVLGTLVLALAMAPLLLFKPKVYDAAVERLTGTSREFREGGSFGWRKQENAIALDRIQERPLLGVGMGGQYKTVRSSVGSFEIELTYIHNGYLFFPLKMGLWAAVVPWVIAFVVLRRGWLGYRNASDADTKSTIGAASTAFFTIVLVSFTQPEWSNVSGIAAIALLIAIVEAFGGVGIPRPPESRPADALAVPA